MDAIQILGKTVPVEFVEGEGANGPPDHATLLTGAGAMAALINGKNWSDDQRGAFQGIKKIVFFKGKVRVNGHLMDRPCCDEDDAIFYWEAEEFERNTDADVRANTFFHDCWHVVQFKREGGFAQPGQEQVEREVDAINEQIKVARILGNSPDEIKFLEEFRDDQQRIRDRLEEGVNNKIAPHKPGALPN